MVLNLCIFLCWFRQNNFFSGEINIMHYELNSLKLKTSRLICFLQTHRLSLHKMWIDGLGWCGLFVDYCDVFISCLDSHFDGTHSLQRIHWWASDLSKSFLMKKQTYPNLGWPESKLGGNFQHFFFFHFWVIYSFNAASEDCGAPFHLMCALGRLDLNGLQDST